MLDQIGNTFTELSSTLTSVHVSDMWRRYDVFGTFTGFSSTSVK